MENFEARLPEMREQLKELPRGRMMVLNCTLSEFELTRLREEFSLEWDFQQRPFGKNSSLLWHMVRRSDLGITSAKAFCR